MANSAADRPLLSDWTGWTFEFDQLRPKLVVGFWACSTTVLVGNILKHFATKHEVLAATHIHFLPVQFDLYQHENSAPELHMCGSGRNKWYRIDCGTNNGSGPNGRNTIEIWGPIPHGRSRYTPIDRYVRTERSISYAYSMRTKFSSWENALKISRRYSTNSVLPYQLFERVCAESIKNLLFLRPNCHPSVLVWDTLLLSLSNHRWLWSRSLNSNGIDTGSKDTSFTSIWR